MSRALRKPAQAAKTIVPALGLGAILSTSGCEEPTSLPAPRLDHSVPFAHIDVGAKLNNFDPQTQINAVVNVYKNKNGQLTFLGTVFGDAQGTPTRFNYQPGLYVYIRVDAVPSSDCRWDNWSNGSTADPLDTNANWITGIFDCSPPGGGGGPGNPGDPGPNSLHERGVDRLNRSAG